MVATAGEAQGWGQGCTHRVQLRPLRSKGSYMGLMGDLGMGQDTCHVILLGRLWALVYSKVR